MKNLYALIMAGGGGTRLWPLSRRKRPKQMLALVGDRTMFQMSVERLAPLLPPERIFVVTGRDQVADLQRDTPQIPPENFVIEPFAQNNGPAVGLATMHIQQHDPDAMIAVLTADHHIANTEKFLRVIEAAAELAQQNYIVTLGIAPTSPSTGFGYIRRGEVLAEVQGFQTYHAEQFTEKPDLETAIEFLSTGLYSWNSGMFIYQASTGAAEYARQQPEMSALLTQIQAAIGTEDYQTVLDTVWPDMPRLSIDYAIMEGARHMAVIPVEIGWSDIGSWGMLFDLLERDADGNIMRGESKDHNIVLDTKDTLIVSDRKVATIGLENLVIVNTPDALLVCHRERSQEVRTVIDRLKQNGGESLL